MNRRLMAVCACIGAALGSGGAACAANCGTIAVSPSAPNFSSWNPLNPANQQVPFVVTFARASASTKSVRLIFLDANSNAIPTRIGTTTGPRYQIVNTDSGAIVSFPSGTSVTSQTVAVTQTSNGSANSFTINMSAVALANSSPTEDFIGGAAYTETLNYAMQCFKANGQDNGVDSGVVSGLTLNLTIPKILSIVTASPVAIDFANFTSTSQQARISVKSTSTLNVAVSTSYGSRLVRNGAVPPFPTNSIIPYGMKFNGVAVAPSQPLVNQARAGVTGSSYPLQLTLTDGIPSGKLAGSYSDTITLTLTPGQ
ncbi:MAG TPA: hypothetical protein VKQ27_03445 [Acetobacteraceae bacterium]|nr:hypothetical protein [Acetobacteraceae bacterium]